MNDNYKNKILVLTILTVIFTIMGSTLAYWNWTSTEDQRTLITFETPANLSCTADGGGNITASEKNIMPTTCTDQARAIQRTITLNTSSQISTNDIYLDLWLDVVNIGEGLTNSRNFKYALTKNASSCTSDVIESGSFNGITDGGRIKLLKNKEYIGTNEDIYYLYIWLDAAEENRDTMNQSFNLKLGGNCQDDLPPQPSSPVLDESGMIPVTIDNSGNVKTISKDDDNWYNYDEKKWANAILVTESSRANYLNTNNVPVTQSDILAYYVWIPKYSYKMNSSSGTSNESEISISWNYNESGYIPHPAFTFEEGMTGFWVGKFETTGTASQPTILNNKSSLRSQKVSVQFTTSLLFSGGSMDTSSGAVTFAGSSTYGLTTETNSHMMKNSEWGAVAYLSHSQYGINSEIRINNYYLNETKTGCGAETAAASSSSTCTLAYGSGINEYPQSTTGNITGVFDMSGGAWEYVMGNYNNTAGNSGFTKFPESKYYDVYTFTSTSSCTTETCGGHALNETSGWYVDSAYFVSSSKRWFIRGGNYGYRASAGAFNFDSNNGDSHDDSSWRSVLSAR